MTLLEAAWPYIVMLIWAFGAATILPLSSEVVLLAQIKAGLGDPAGLVIVATIGNVGGSTLNWWLGRHMHRFAGRRWFPFDSAKMASASKRFRSWGIWSLLL